MYEPDWKDSDALRQRIKQLEFELANAKEETRTNKLVVIKLKKILDQEGVIYVD